MREKISFSFFDPCNLKYVYIFICAHFELKKKRFNNKSSIETSI